MKRRQITLSEAGRRSAIAMAVAHGGSPVLRLTSQAKLAASLNEWAWADAAINELRHFYFSEQMTNEEYLQVKVVCLLCWRFDVINELYNQAEKFAFDFEFGVAQHSCDVPPCCFEMRADSPDKCSVLFHPDLNTLYWAEVVAVRTIFMLPLVNSYMKFRNFKAGTFIFDMGDNGSVPAFSFSGYNTSNLIPDAIFIESDGYRSHRDQFRRKPVPWSERRDTLLWRGTTTGVADNWRDLPRVKLCIWAKLSPHREYLDIYLSDIVQRSDDDAEAIRQENIIGQFVSAADFQKYKYHIDIDGNTNSWPGLFIKLLTGSTVLKVESEHGYKQWYYDKLKPWFNYIPVSSDLSDLDDIVLWLKNNDSKAEKIGHAGAALADDLSFQRELERTAQKMRESL
ncbi:glycosyl transferase family 90 [Methylobacterium durans]|uniref:glycosyl transferase family 90 n=1 Tax=Methylobacterium durans TaxID=2202825 RepID=UPI002AFE730D|nr:glycosyl transferase family 90 [Methylobacterium durans]MEA1832409.1 glycosyl transferase family 90 [Methylobacterium durans]